MSPRAGAGPIPVIIVSYNTCDLLRECLASLALAEAPVLPVVVDNASADGSAAMVRAEFPAAALLEPGANLGFARANNLGIRHALERCRPPALLLLNPDAALTAGALERLLDFLAAHPRVGMVAPRLIYPDGGRQPAAFRFPTLLMTAFDFWPPRGRGFGRLYDHPLNGRYREDGGAEPFPIDHPLGAAMLVRTEVIEETGAFDESFWLYAEEVEWCWRIRRAGWAIWQQPQATVIHAGGASSAQFRTRSFLALQRARLQFFDKAHGAAWGRAHRLLARAAALHATLNAGLAWARGRIDGAELRRRTWAMAELWRLMRPAAANRKQL
ncbi:MAG TPA: glycosyltransferase family 2 protein [Herpetosiphonaceae bacterium]